MPDRLPQPPAMVVAALLAALLPAGAAGGLATPTPTLGRGTARG
jgi:hypothetical protein